MGTTMRKQTLAIGLAVAVLLSVPAGRAQDAINDGAVFCELYVWNRVADFLEILRGGVAVGPTIGAELAVTEYAQLGAYTAREKGATFPHFVPPLWILSYLDDAKVFVPHRGVYSTASVGPRRWESNAEQDMRFERSTWDVRAQVGLGLFQPYLALSPLEVADFIVGFACTDLSRDDQEIDPSIRREPVNQLGRGVTNVVCGALEIPLSMHEVDQEKGGFAAVTAGFAQGCWRFLTREGVGLLEIVTFPMGWGPIIEPEFPFQPGRSTNWRVNQPEFRKQL